MSDWIGRTLSKVEIQKLVGRGGMADVYLGRHTTLNRLVAVKILHAHLSDNDTLLSRFRAEAQAVAGMRHPHIVQVLDFDISGDRPYIVMELLEGLSLKDYLTKSREQGLRLPPETITFLISALAGALDYAHARGVVHRDIKPANVMLRRENGLIDPSQPLPLDVQPVLTDFGVARMADASVQTASGTIIGTPAYMSPEQVRGETVDARSDIYSLGIMLYEMLSGQLPFDGDTQASILIKHIAEPVPQLTGASPELQAVVDQALAKTPVERFQRASDLATALEVALGLAAKTSATEQLVAPRRRPVDDDNPESTLAISPQPALTTASLAPTPDVTVQSSPAPASPVIWVAGVAGVLALVISVAALLMGRGERPSEEGPGAVEPSADMPATESGADQPPPGPTLPAPTFTPAPEEPVLAPGSPVGLALIRDSDVSISLSGLTEPPADSAYEAWLTDPEQPPLSLGVLEFAAGEAGLSFTEPGGVNLLMQYSEVVVTMEPAAGSGGVMTGPVIYSGRLEPETQARLRLMFSVARGIPLQQAVTEGVMRQSVAYDSHRQYTIDAIRSSNLPSAVSHAEHVINIVVGRESPEYLDYNGNGRPENPGDGVGLENYLLILQEAAVGAASTPGAAAETISAAEELAAQIDDLLLVVNDAKNDELSITVADTIDEVLPLAADLDSLAVTDAAAQVAETGDTLTLMIAVPISSSGN